MWLSSSHESRADASHNSQSAFQRPASFRILSSRRVGESPATARLTTSTRHDGPAHAFSHRSRCRVYMSSVVNPVAHGIRRPEHEDPVGSRGFLETDLGRSKTQAIGLKSRSIPADVEIGLHFPAKIGREFLDDPRHVAPERQPARRRLRDIAGDFAPRRVDEALVIAERRRPGGPRFRPRTREASKPGPYLRPNPRWRARRPSGPAPSPVDCEIIVRFLVARRAPSHTRKGDKVKRCVERSKRGMSEVGILPIRE